MSAPVCPVHGTVMRASQRGGGFYCPSKLADGTFCKEKVAAPKPAPASAPAPSGTAAAQLVAQPAPRNDAALAAAAFDLAAKTCGEVHPEDQGSQDQIIAYAVRAYQAMKVVMP